MKASKILLRWYKSFNVNYRPYPDRRHGVIPRPWNSLHVEGGSESDYEFVEIPLERDTTTIVGANESGKSHLISAISKVIIGQGIPEDSGKPRPFARTDLCHFASVRSKNAEAWPNIGMEFREMTPTDINALKKAVSQSLNFGTEPRFTIILAPKSNSTPAYLYPANQSEPVPLTSEQLNAVRQVLPRVMFIKSDLAIADDVPVSDLLAAMGATGPNKKPYFGFLAAQAVAEFILGFAATPNRQITEAEVQQINQLKSGLSNTNQRSNATLEAKLFDVLGITSEAVGVLAGLDESDRSYAEGLIAIWNDEIDRALNLSHYWQQDDLFRLRLNFKRGIIYFEITDKTGATYTFRERSSGLRYFLSYYIQAKALETATRQANCIILMDEPDSFLSIIGQRNLLAVFESLVSADTSRQNTQLIYTTHSPFLINRNFPRRIRLVQKGDAEEGTQFVDESRLRRYEPVRSALGIDCSQTLFMGATNVVLEGPTDQYLLTELVRAFVKPDNVSDFLDLNSITFVSADSAPGIPKLLAASRWGDERNPATVVIFDADGEGQRQRTFVTEPTEEKTTVTKVKQKRQRLIEPQFAVFVNELLADTIDGQKIVTTEDILPPKLYAEALKAYVEKWHPTVLGDKQGQFESKITAPTFGSNGLVTDTLAVTEEFLHPGRGSYDKMGVLQEAIRIVLGNQQSSSATKTPNDLESRLRDFCRNLRQKIEMSEQAERRETGKQAVVRVIREFFIRHKESAAVFDVELVLVRLDREAELLGPDGTTLSDCLRSLLERIRKLRSANQQRLTGQEWLNWHAWIQAIRKDPLEVSAQQLSETVQNPPQESSTPAQVTPINDAMPPALAAEPIAADGQQRPVSVDEAT